MKLAIIGDTRHSRDAEGRLFTLSPVVRQLKPWLERFDSVTFCGTLRPGSPPSGHEPYRHGNVRLRELPCGGGDTASKKAELGLRIAQWWPVLRREIRDSDAIYFRCPCNIALVGLFAMRGLRARRFAMYAGNWGGYEGESPFYRLQRRLLNSPGFDGTAAVYGSWPNQPEHVLTSFSPSFTLDDWRAQEPAVRKKLSDGEMTAPLDTLRTVTVGHLNHDKNQASILHAAALLRERGITLKLELLGDGPKRPELENLVQRLRIADRVRLRGYVTLAEVSAAYATADVGILASRTEGFPKVVAEAMAAGAAVVASDVGLNRQLLGDGKRGLVFPYDAPVALAEALRQLAVDPRRLRSMGAAGREYARTITLEAYYELQERILSERLGFAAPMRVREEAFA